VKIYVAAPFQMRNDAIKVMHWLVSHGHTVTSRWLVDIEDPSDLSKQADYANKCMTAIINSDVILALNTPEWANAGTGGRHIELGYALALGKQIVLLGVRSNVFHHLECVRVIDRLEDL
jgi:nucleoside 2-deoxyribosyltransferase